MKDIRNKLLIITGIILGVLAVAAVIRAVTNRAPRVETARQKPIAAASRPTASDRQIRVAQDQVERAPADPRGYNLLCAAYMKKARETGDFGFNAKAEAVLTRSFEVAAPKDNYDAIKLKATLLLSYHRFGEALEIARHAQALQPQDHDNYGAITDALVELGDYQGAFEAAQTMMDMRPGTPSYSRVSYLRGLQGDTEGAIEAMRAAAEAASPRDPESIAWCRVHLGDELMNAGKLAAAEREYDIALYVFPKYHLALASKARARLASGDTETAIEFYKQAQARVPLPETAIALGDLYTRLNRSEEAKRQYNLVEFIERAGSTESQTYSRQLALFWADHDMKLDEALAIARRERAARADIFTCDALAWCLYKKGQLAEAKATMDEALRLGTRDARLFYHAGMIYNGLGDRRNAAKYLKLALQVNPAFDVLQADVARQTLRTIAV
ncbi:MAG: tetratricopeptide repeat protein [Pyrinomonadaceae bacterium]|nr:tetratricopeptide repeat protein [Pyrinomonadaceae bacterium]